METMDILLLIGLTVSALTTVMSTRMVRAVIGLAVTSVFVTVLMFRLEAPLAAVFELSVCAGLIPAIFISVIGLTRRLSPEALTEARKNRLRRAGYLPVIVILAGIALSQVHIPMEFAVVADSTDVRNVLWNLRHVDLLGQIAVLLGGAFGVVVLLKEYRNA
jgi:NADH-quinone oxidoreductase subunit J